MFFCNNESDETYNLHIIKSSENKRGKLTKKGLRQCVRLERYTLLKAVQCFSCQEHYKYALHVAQV